MARQTSTQTQPRRITIDDVARAAGVSTGTVSRVLNDRPAVRASTRARVLAAVERLHYRPDQAARELSFRRPVRIGLSIAPVGRRLTPFYMLFLERLMEAFATEGYRLEEVPCGADGLPVHLADAMVLFGAHDDDPRVPFLSAREVPTVLIGRSATLPSVAPDDRDGGRQAAAHLLRLGRHRILHITGGIETQAAFDRYDGYRSALVEAGVPADDGLLMTVEPTSLGAYRALRRGLEGGLELDAVFAASDEMAVGARAALEDAGLGVPLDVSVVGFDDLPEIGETLTTVRQDIAAVARQAAALVREALAGAAPRHVTVPVQLISRASTARRR